MATEIERKFLVNIAKWEICEKETGNYLKQGYISIEPEKTIRIRKSENNAFLTIKGITVNATRDEFEYEIPLDDASALLEKFCKHQLEKIRYKVNYKGKTWEIDEFLGSNAGLIVAEIELNDEEEKFEKPEWLEKEVTNESKYYNSNLTFNPYLSW